MILLGSPQCLLRKHEERDEMQKIHEKLMQNVVKRNLAIIF